MNECIIIPIKREPNATTCEDDRTINLVTHESKILLRVLTMRIQSRSETENCTAVDQHGFRKGNGTRGITGVDGMKSEQT